MEKNNKLDYKKYLKKNLSYQKNREYLLTRNALVTNDINTLATNVFNPDKNLNEFLIDAQKPSFSITDQDMSGRCWIFAGLNALRRRTADNLKMSNFVFSQTYMDFWDKYERANTFLHKMVEKANIDLDDRDLNSELRNAGQDGGWYGYFDNLVNKYGLVPQEIMPDSFSGHNTFILNELLQILLIKATKEIRANQKDSKKQEDIIKSTLKKVLEMLILAYGPVPTKFDWQYQADAKKEEENKEKDKKEEDSKKSEQNKALENKEANKQTEELKKQEEKDKQEFKEIKAEFSYIKGITPLEFAKEYVKYDSAEFLDLWTIGNDQDYKINQKYELKDSNNIIEAANFTFLNVDKKILKLFTLANLISKQTMWFAADVLHYRDNKTGAFDNEHFDYDALFNSDFSIDRNQQVRHHFISSNHAMAICGVDFDEQKTLNNQKALVQKYKKTKKINQYEFALELANTFEFKKWRIENSWGGKVGVKGFYYMTDSWFNDYLIDVVVSTNAADNFFANPKFINEELIDLVKQLKTKEILKQAIESKPILIDGYDPLGTNLKGVK
ncbi:aminopeptidase [Mycoplasma sp. T363T]|uniref:C1 family peptidase n=1 Tax=Mycoplasma bradburyae TaxID=2963128 RepID=UPI0023421678|nr:C1 family peptidase [Mycoplasma bradburyae]MDC4163410.1 aminopeptidase [Mycoplasma bradburyae]